MRDFEKKILNEIIQKTKLEACPPLISVYKGDISKMTENLNQHWLPGVAKRMTLWQRFRWWWGFKKI